VRSGTQGQEGQDRSPEKEGRCEADFLVQRATLGRLTAPASAIEPGAPGARNRCRRSDRNCPRSAFEGHVRETPWDNLRGACFGGYAIWTYLSQPFLYAYPGFMLEEIDPWEEDGETWRWLKVIFPDQIASQTRQQVSYFGPDGLMRRHDYTVDVPAGVTGSTMFWTAGSLTAL
jgi:hypothetical protein